MFVIGRKPFSDWSCHNNTSYFVDFCISAAKLRFPFEKTMLFRQVFTRYDVKKAAKSTMKLGNFFIGNVL